jgi:hypothetical protein
LSSAYQFGFRFFSTFTSTLTWFCLDPLNPDPSPQAVRLKEQDDDHGGKGKDLLDPARGVTAEITIG